MLKNLLIMITLLFFMVSCAHVQQHAAGEAIDQTRDYIDNSDCCKTERDIEAW